MHDYQIEAINFIKNKRFCGLWLDMGMGKTATTLTAIKDLIDDFSISKALIICPLRVAKNVWAQEALNWEHLRDLTFSVCCGSAIERKESLQSNAQIHIINVDNVKWLVENYKWDYDYLIIDESSCFKNASSKRFKAIKKIRHLPFYITLLTGTPSPNSYLDLWSQTYILDAGLRLGRTISSFKNQYFTPDRWGYNHTLNAGADGKIKAKINDVYLSLSNENKVKCHYVNEMIKLPEVYQNQYNYFFRTFCLDINEQVITAVNAAVLTNKLLQVSNGAIYKNDTKEYEILHDFKLKRLEKLIKENPNKNFLVAYAFKSDLIRLLNRFKFAKTIDDNHAIEDWNAGNIKMLIAHPKSAGHGLNLQKGGHMVVWFGMMWSLELYQQFNARLARQGQPSEVTVHHILCKDTIDERVLNVLNARNCTQKDLIESIKGYLKGAT